MSVQASHFRLAEQILAATQRRILQSLAFTPVVLPRAVRYCPAPAGSIRRCFSYSALSLTSGATYGSGNLGRHVTASAKNMIMRLLTA